MDIQVTGRHFPVTPQLRTYVTEKTGRLEKYFDRTQRIEVVLDHDKKGQFEAEMIAHAPRGRTLVCRAAEATGTAAVDVVLEKMERQLKKLKERLQGKDGRKTGRFEKTAVPSETSEIDTGDEA